MSTVPKQAKKRLYKVGKQFVTGFLTDNSNAVVLRSRDPGVCWKADDTVGFAVVSEFSGPHALGINDKDVPTLFRLRINYRPPPALYYALRSKKAKQQLGLQQSVLLSNSPLLELTAIPEELGLFGKWILIWLDCQLYRRPTPPSPPVDLFAWGWDENGNEFCPNLFELGPQWLNSEYLWTKSAMEQFKPWLMK